MHGEIAGRLARGTRRRRRASVQLADDPRAQSGGPARGRVRARALVCGLAVACLCTALFPFSAGAAQSRKSNTTPVEKGLAFYRGKTITLIVAGSLGGAADLAARVYAQYFANYLQATVDVTDNNVATSIAGSDQMAKAVPDGLTIGTLNLATDMALAITGQPGLNFNPIRLGWILDNQTSTSPLLALSSSPYTSIESLEHAKSPVRVLVQTNGISDIETRALLTILKVPVQWIPGYSSTSAILQGFERGDGDIADINLGNAGPLIAAGKARALAVSVKAPPGLAFRQYMSGLPTFSSLMDSVSAKSKQARLEVAAVKAIFASGNSPIVTQTAVPAYKLDALRAAAIWMEKQAGLKSALLAQGSSTSFIDPETAKLQYISILKAAASLRPFITG